jgi:hypothetical protein
VEQLDKSIAERSQYTEKVQTRVLPTQAADRNQLLNKSVAGGGGWGVVSTNYGFVCIIAVLYPWYYTAVLYSSLKPNEYYTVRMTYGTAILFNSEQLNRQIASTRDTKFCKWLHQLCPDSGYESEHEMDPVDEDEDAVGGSVDEFDRVNISEGVDGMHDEDIFEAEEVMDEASRVTSTNEVDGGPLSVV